MNKNKLSFKETASLFFISCLMMFLPAIIYLQSFRTMNIQPTNGRYENFILEDISLTLSLVYIITFFIINIYLISFIFSSHKEFNIKIKHYKMIMIYNISFCIFISSFYLVTNNQWLLYISIGYGFYIIFIYSVRWILNLKEFVNNKFYQLKTRKNHIKI